MLLRTNVGTGQEGKFASEITDQINEFGLDIRLQKTDVVETQGSSVSGKDGDTIVKSIIHSGDKLFEVVEDVKWVRLRCLVGDRFGRGQRWCNRRRNRRPSLLHAIACVDECIDH